VDEIAAKMAVERFANPLAVGNTEDVVHRLVFMFRRWAQFRFFLVRGLRVRCRLGV
jgi:hypothetical protein